MIRLKWSVVSSAMAMALASCATLAMAQQADSARYTAALVAGSVHVFQVPGRAMVDNVAASVGRDGVLLIDTGPARAGAQIRTVLAGLSDRPVRLVVNSHYHHASANAELGRGATVIAHARARERMTGPTRMYGMMPTQPWPDSALPVITFQDSLTLHFNDERVDLVHFGGAHTDGDVVAFFRGSNVVVTGDLFAPLLAPCDLANGCEWSEYEAGIRRLLSLTPADARLIPGHGPVSTRRDLEEFASMLSEVTARVRQRVGEGRTVDEIKREGLPARWRAWADRGIPADFFLTNVYEGIAGRRR